MWMHLGMVECRVPFLCRCDLDLFFSFNEGREDPHTTMSEPSSAYQIFQGVSGPPAPLPFDLPMNIWKKHSSWDSKAEESHYFSLVFIYPFKPNGISFIYCFHF